VTNKPQMRKAHKDIDLEDFEGTVAKAIKFLQGFIDEFGENITFEVHYDWDSPGYFILNYQRLETEFEMKARLRGIESARKARVMKDVRQKAKDLRAYERIGEKYGL